MSTKFSDHLYPKGRSATEPNLLPSVKDSDGNDVLFNSEKRKTTQSTVVNLGSAPNSNDGDPLRTSFGKINNFMEATYWVNESINQKFRDIDSELRDGITIYTDSDERANISLLGESKFYFRGTPNQIEMNVTKVKSANNPYDFDSEVSINFQFTETVEISTLKVKENATFDSDVLINGNLVVEDHSDLKGKVHIFEGLTVDSDTVLSADLRVDSDVIIKGQLTVGEQTAINDSLYVKGKGTFDSDVRINGGLEVYREATFYDDVLFVDNATFDSDVMIRGTLTVNGTTTAVNSTNLEVRDNLIVLNYGQTSPFNDIGFIFTRYDSDLVSSTNFNTALVWDELTGQFIFGQTESSGILPNPTLTQQYIHIGDQIEFFDSDNQVRMEWDKTQATLKILRRDGTAAFDFNADTGIMSGNGEIDGGLF